MAFILLVIVVVIIIFVFKIVLSATSDIRTRFATHGIKGVAEKEWLPYYKKNYLMTKAEYNFFRILESILKDDYYIYPQVNLASIVTANVGRWETYKYRNPINRKILDYVIFDKQHLSPLLVIELDDATHQLIGRRERDILVDKVLDASGISIAHIRTHLSYNVPELSKYILSKLPIKQEPKKMGDMAH